MENIVYRSSGHIAPLLKEAGITISPTQALNIMNAQALIARGEAPEAAVDIAGRHSGDPIGMKIYDNYVERVMALMPAYMKAVEAWGAEHTVKPIVKPEPKPVGKKEPPAIIAVHKPAVVEEETEGAEEIEQDEGVPRLGRPPSDAEKVKILIYVSKVNHQALKAESERSGVPVANLAALAVDERYNPRRR
jgi:hypothetical protein